MSELKCKRCGADEKTDFTKEFIAEARESITEPGVERYICIPVQLEMLDEIERLQSRIAELEAEIDQLTADSTDERQDDKWIPVSERLPKEKQSVLALDRTGTAYHWEYSKCLSNIFVGNYTHWMPLPEPPEVQE